MVQFFRSKISSFFKEKHLSDLLRGGATTFYLRIIGHAIGLLLILFISRVYGAKVLGEYSLALTVVALGSLVSRLGFESSIVKLFSTRRINNDWIGIRHIYKSILKINFLFGLFISILIFFGSEYLANEVFHKPNMHVYFKIVAFLIVPLSLRLINATSYLGFREVANFAYSKHISYFLYALIILLILTLINKNDLNPIIAYASGLLLLSISSTLLIFKKISKNINVSSPNNNLPASRELLRLSVPMMLTMASVVLAGQLIKFLLGIHVTEVELGVFNAAFSAVMIQNFIQNATNSITGPKFAEAHHQNQFSDLQKISSYASKINVYLTTPISIVLILFNKLILSIFGPEFVQGSTVFIIMLAGNAVSVLCGPSGSLMNMTGLQKQLRNILIITLATSFIAALILVPKYGLIGGAISYSLFVILWNVTCSSYVLIKSGIITFFWPFLPHNFNGHKPTK